MNQKAGIVSYGAYLPRYRLDRQLIAQANAWFNPGLRGLARGERTVAGWDEDSVTMAVEAARSAIAGANQLTNQLASVVVTSTTFPFADRHHAGIVAAAINADRQCDTFDAGGGQRASTTAVRMACDTAVSRQAPVLVTSGEHRKTKAASAQEMRYGDGAAAVLIGSQSDQAPLLASLSGSATQTRDFIAQFRAADNDYDYAWEERWIRDEGYYRIVPEVVQAALESAGLEAGDIAHFCMPCVLPRVPQALGKRMGLGESAVRDNLMATVGDTGVAHPLLMLAGALDEASPGDHIMVASFGEGCDVLIFTVTDALPAWRDNNPLRLQRSLERSKPLDTYQKMLAFNHTVDLDHGMRAEVNKGSPMSLLNRNQEMVLSLIGGECEKCGTVQYPKDKYCVNPDCQALDSQQPYSFADKQGKVISYTADMLTYSPNPPAFYGMVQFDGGGRMLADISDIDADKLDVGLAVGMSFRIKDFDTTRGFVRYFWKATPV